MNLVHHWQRYSKGLDHDKLAVFPPTGEGVLYIYNDNPHELNNRWGDSACADIRVELIHQLLEQLIWSDRLDMPRPCDS